jgi:anti-sigma factor RsiW
MAQDKIRMILDRILHFGGFGCSHTERLLFKFVEGELDPQTQKKLENHISDCPPCLSYVDGYRRTIQLTHSHGCPEVEMPLALQRKLEEFIQQNPNLHP